MKLIVDYFHASVNTCLTKQSYLLLLLIKFHTTFPPSRINIDCKYCITVIYLSPVHQMNIGIPELT